MGLHLQGTVSLDGSGFEAGLNRIEHSAEKVGETLKGLALSAFGIYGIEQAIHKTIETAEKLVDTSNRLGIGLEKLQEFGFAAKQSGADIDALTTFIERLNSTRLDPKKFESFAKLGIGQSDLDKLKVEDLILKLSASIRTRSPQEVIGPLRDIGGKGAGQMIPMLREDLDELAEAAHQLGVIISSEDLVMLKFLGDEMTVLGQIMIKELAPAVVLLGEAVHGMLEVIKSDWEFWKSFAGDKGVRSAVKTIAGELFSPHLFNQNPDAVKSAFDTISKAFADAGAKSESSQITSAEDFVRLRNMLMEKQALMEQIGRTPDFENVMKPDKTPKSHLTQIGTDSLLRVGNFLGSSANPMVHIAHQQLQVLHQIARNTQWRSSPGHHAFPHQ